MPVTKDIIYPIFLECCQIATDKFWENIFEDLSYGKTPCGTYISKDHLSCNYKDKEFKYKIEKKNPEVIYNDVCDLLTNRLGLLSQKEKVRKRLEFNSVEKEIKDSRTTWSSIRKKSVKDLLIEKYVIEMKQKHNLSLKQSRYLLSIIFTAIVFKVITFKDIDYCDGKINNIDGIDFAKRRVVLKRDIYKTDVSFAPNILIDKKSMSENWEKYLLNLKKITYDR